jgi:large subunit ribosomal protein L13
MKTYSPKPEHIERRWYVIDASEKVLGRVASEAAALLRGKHKPIFAPHMDTGDHVIIVNADKVVLTGGKEMKKYAYRHSGYPGGITATRYDDLMRTRPVFAVEKAIKGMLPKNRLGRSMSRKLHVVPGPEHPHAAQTPVAYTLGQPPAWAGLPEPVSELKPRHRTAAEPEETGRAGEIATDEGASTIASESAAPKKPAAKKTAAKKTTAKRTAGKKTTATKTAAKKTAAKKTAAKKTAAKKTAAKKTTAKRSAAKKTTARKTTAKAEENEE